MNISPSMNEMHLNLQIIWTVFLIASPWSFQIADAKKLWRNTDDLQRVYTYCLVTYFKDDFIPPWYRDELLYGEYIGEFCEGTNVFNVEEKMKKYFPGDEEIGKTLEECFSDWGYNGIYQDYYKFGDKEFNKLHDQKINEHQELHTLQTSTPKKDTDIEFPISEDEANKQDILNLSKFVLGLCNRDKPLKFEELQDDDEKKSTIDCLETCASKLITRLNATLNYLVKGEIMENIQKRGITEERIEEKKINIDEFPDEIQYLEEDSKISKLESSFTAETYMERLSKKKDLKTMTDTGIEFLIHYSRVYSNQNKYLCKINLTHKPNIAAHKIEKTDNNGDVQNEDHNNSVIPQQQRSNFKKTVDEMLSHYFVYFKFCAEKGCFMKKSSVPLLDYAYNVANGVQDESTQSNQTPIDESQLKFFKVLISEDDHDDEEDDDDDAS